MVTMRPTTPAPEVAHVPEELRNVPRWVTWSYEPREKNGSMKWTKVPYNATSPLASRAKANPTDPTTWAPFLTAVMAEIMGREKGIYDGIGLVLNGTDFMAIDL